MRKIKFLSVVIALVFSGNILFAQSIDDGKKFLNYERYNSARDIFLKLVTANPNNADAVYWLGQTYIESGDVASARALYLKTLSANPNSPLILAGVGHVELLDNKLPDARNHFETAISLSKGRDANVLLAVGRANVDVPAGDGAYAIDKLKIASDLNKKSSEIQIELGDAYRKMTDGANAQTTYTNALALDPNNARADYMIGRIYQTQGFGQEAIYMRYYNEAIAKDPKFSPVYEWLSEYYYHRDINKAREYLDKYIAVADQDSKNCYYQASFLYASGKFQDAINKSKECITLGGANPYPKLYGLEAYAYDKLNDSLDARNAFAIYFQKLPVDQLGPLDYATYGKELLKFPGSATEAAGYIDKAISMDTIESEKVDFISSVAQNYLATGNYLEAGNWYNKLLGVKHNYGKVDIYNAGYNYYKGGNYKGADQAFALYTQKYPTDIFGVYMRARASEGLDSTGAQGLAKPFYDQVIVIADTTADKEKVKAQLLTAYKYNVAYYYNTKNDRATALQYTQKILLVDPTNAQAMENEKALMSPSKTKNKTNDTKEKVTPSKTKVKDK
ncbi:MAG: tetratricopeptide repeat protein [Chitinophagaceae bacterium]|nr:tetratricopeptide repeat protein [Chitinophagaceae bacterium]